MRIARQLFQKLPPLLALALSVSLFVPGSVYGQTGLSLQAGASLATLGGSDVASADYRIGMRGMALAMVSSSLRAQSVADHTRLFSAGPTVTGMAAAVNDQQVELLQEAASPSFAYGNISELQESAGAQSQWKAGLKWGAMAGGGVGLLAGNLVGESCDVLVDIVEAFDADTDEGCGGFRIGAMLLYGAFGGAVGGLVGMGVGALIKTEPEVSASLGSTVFTFSPTIVPRLGLEGRPGLVLGTHVAF